MYKGVKGSAQETNRIMNTQQHLKCQILRCLLQEAFTLVRNAGLLEVAGVPHGEVELEEESHC